MKKITLGIIGCALFVACDGDNSNPTATTGTTADVSGDSTGDTSNPTNEEVDVGVVTPGTVKALQAEATLVDCVADATNGFVSVNPTVTVSGAVVMSAKFDAREGVGGLDGYYIADAAGGTFSGIKVTIEREATAVFDNTTGFAVGETVDVAGELQEFFCLTQLKAATMTSTGTGTGNAALAIAPGDVGEAVESTLVKLSGVKLEAASAQGGLKIEGTDIAVSFDISTGFIDLVVGGKYDITGFIGFAFDKWQILPRGPADITVIELPVSDTVAITAIQGADISKTCPNPAPQFQNGVDGAQIEGVITAGKFAVTASIDGYIVSDETQAPYSSVLVTAATSAATNFAVGDKVKVTGDHQEFYCQTQFRSSLIEKTGTGTPPAPLVITKSESNLEQYEGMLVEIANVAVTGDDGHGAATTDAGVLIDKTIMGGGFTAPASGTTLTTLRGIVVYSFDMYRVSPRSAADIVAAP